MFLSLLRLCFGEHLFTGADYNIELFLSALTRYIFTEEAKYSGEKSISMGLL
jgi:hypothetical protein